MRLSEALSTGVLKNSWELCEAFSAEVLFKSLEALGLHKACEGFIKLL